MPRTVTLTSTQPLQRAEAIGGAISRTVSDAVGGFTEGHELATQQNEYKRKIEAAQKSKKAFQQLKKETEVELTNLMKGKDYNYVTSRFKAVRGAKDVETLTTISKNIVGEIEGFKKYSKEYANLSLDAPSIDAPGVVLSDPKYGDNLVAGWQGIVDKTNKKNLDARVNEIISRPGNEKLLSEDVVQMLAKETGQDPGAMSKEARAAINDAFISRKEKMMMELAGKRESRQARATTARMDDITNKSFVALEKKANTAAAKILAETKVDIRNLTDPAQFIASKEFNDLEDQRKTLILGAIEKQKEFEAKKKLASAAAKLGIQGLTEAKLDVIYKDATDTDGPTDPQTKQLWEGAGLTGTTTPPPAISTVSTKEEWQKLAPGTKYKAPDGSVRVKK